MARKGSSGRRKVSGALGQIDSIMKADASRGVISMSVISNITKNMPIRDANAVFETFDKNYPMLEGYRYTDLGIGGYNYYKRNSKGSWIRVNNWHEPYPKYLTSESAKRGFVNLQIYGAAGKVEY